MLSISEKEYFMLISHKTLISKDHIEKHKSLLDALAVLENYSVDASDILKNELIMFCKILKTEKSIDTKNIIRFQDEFILMSEEFIYDHKLNVEKLRMIY